MILFICFCRHHYTDAKFLQLLERLLMTLCPSDCELSDWTSLKFSEMYEMIVSHSAFLPTMLSRTSTDVKGDDYIVLPCSSSISSTSSSGSVITIVAIIIIVIVIVIILTELTSLLSLNSYKNYRYICACFTY